MIRQAGFKDIQGTAKIFEDIIAHEEHNTKYTAFQPGIYPTHKTALKALNENSLYVCELESEISACLIMNKSQPPEYRNVLWKFTAPDENIIVIHLLCVRPDKSGAGLGREMLGFAIDWALSHDSRAIRLDTGAQNTPARYLYETSGFQLAGASSMSIGGIIAHDNHLFYERLTDLEHTVPKTLRHYPFP